LPGFDIGKRYSAAIKAHNAEQALLLCRADIVQYTIWHKTNTEPVLPRGGAALELLRIDVNALADYVERLQWLYRRTDRISDWLSVLDRLRNNIRHPRWQRKIAYFRALFYLAPGGDRGKARDELKQIGPITTDEDDIELLQLYVDLEFDDAPFSTKLAYLDRLLALGEERSNQLQYRGGKAVQYLFINDQAAAERELVQAIDLARGTEAEDPFNNFERHLFGRLLQMLATIRQDGSLFEEAIGHFNTLLLDDDWTNIGRVGVLREMGDCHKYAGAWDKAEASYRAALAVADNQLDRIHVAECLRNQKQIEASIEQIDRVDRTALGRHEYEDFVFVLSAIAIWSGARARLLEAKDLLERITIAEPYFNERRLKLLVAVTGTLASGSASAEVKAETTKRGGLASLSASFFQLEPNAMSVGVNFDAVIDQLLERKPRK
jgi:tetratricopeptide (TPR) repeat protein